MWEHFYPVSFYSEAIKTALKSEVATVIDIPIDPEEDVLPFPSTAHVPDEPANPEPDVI